MFRSLFSEITVVKVPVSVSSRGKNRLEVNEKDLRPPTSQRHLSHKQGKDDSAVEQNSA